MASVSHAPLANEYKLKRRLNLAKFHSMTSSFMQNFYGYSSLNNKHKRHKYHK